MYSCWNGLDRPEARDVNKDLTPKDQDKDLTPKDKDLTPKDQDKDLTSKDKDKDLTPKDQDKGKDLKKVLKESLRTKTRTRINIPGHFVFCLTSHNSTSQNIGGTDAWAVPHLKFGGTVPPSPPYSLPMPNGSGRPCV